VKTLKVRFEDLQRMRVPDWIVTQFDFNVQNTDINTQLQYELIDMGVDLAAQSLFKRKKPAWQCNVNNKTAAEYPKLWASVELFLLTFPISYMVEAGVSHANAFLNQRNRLNSEERRDLQLTSPISNQIKMLLLFLTGNTLP